MKAKKTKADSVTVRISKEARRKMKISAAEQGCSFIEYVDMITGNSKRPYKLNP